MRMETWLDTLEKGVKAIWDEFAKLQQYFQKSDWIDKFDNS